MANVESFPTMYGTPGRAAGDPQERAAKQPRREASSRFPEGIGAQDEVHAAM